MINSYFCSSCDINSFRVLLLIKDFNFRKFLYRNTGKTKIIVANPIAIEVIQSAPKIGNIIIPAKIFSKSHRQQQVVFSNQPQKGI